MNSLSLYITTCRSILQSQPDDNGAWLDIQRLLTYLRQSLLCCVCGNLLIFPMTSRSCQQHGICKSCLGRPVSCLRCKNNEGFIEDKQLKLVLQCYKQLCSYLLCTCPNRQWRSLNGENGLSFIDIIQEGAAYRDDSNRDSESSEEPGESEVPPVNGNRNVTNGNYSKSKSRSSTDEQFASGESSRKRLRTQSKTKGAKERVGCRCGMTTANPGKLTCYGQRCPCYAKNISCVDCRCRGCHNPYRKRREYPGGSDNEISFDHCYSPLKAKKK